MKEDAVTPAGGSTGTVYMHPVSAPVRPLPNYTRVPRSRAPAQILNSAARGAQESQQVLHSHLMPVRLVYGRCRLGARAHWVGAYGSRDTVFVCFWGYGKFDAIESVQVNNQDLPAGAVVTSYLGGPNQVADPTLRAIVPGFSDNHARTIEGEAIGLAWSLVRLPTDSPTGWPDQFTAVVRGRAVYDPRDVGQDPDDYTTWGYTTNPALVLADFRRSKAFGAGRAIDWASVATCADVCDEVVGSAPNTEPRRTINWAFEQRDSIDTVTEVLRTAAGVILAPQGGVDYFVPDRPAVVSRSITDANVYSGLRIRSRKRLETPNQVNVFYMDTSRVPWATSPIPATAQTPAAANGAEEVRPSDVTMDWVQSAAQAYREALERLNYFQLQQLEVSFYTDDSAVQDLEGDVISLSLSLGIVAKPMRVTAVRPHSPGLYFVLLEEYDEAVYSDTVTTAPTHPDISLANPLDVPAVTDLVVTEHPYKKNAGIWSTRFTAVWGEVDYPFAGEYVVKLTSGGALVWSTTTQALEEVTPDLVAGQVYTLEVFYRARIGVGGAADSVTQTAQGSGLPPGDVPDLTGLEFGGEVRLDWGEAYDADKYVVKYGAQGAAWGDMTLIDITASLSSVSKKAPPGTFDFAVKARDIDGNESDNAAVVTLEVTIDSDAYFVGEHVFINPTLTNMHTFTDRFGVTQDYPTAGQSVGTLWPNAMDTYANELATYHSNVAAVWLSETWDLGDEYNGTWLVDASAVVDLNGTHTTDIELSSDGSNWAAHSAASVKAQARYARVRITSSGSSTFVVTHGNGEGVKLRLDVVAVEITGEGTTSTSGPVTVVLPQSFSFFKEISVTPVSGEPRNLPVDNLQVGALTSFDVSSFNGPTGKLVAEPFYYKAKGV